MIFWGWKGRKLDLKTTCKLFVYYFRSTIYSSESIVKRVKSAIKHYLLQKWINLEVSSFLNETVRASHLCSAVSWNWWKYFEKLFSQIIKWLKFYWKACSFHLWPLTLASRVLSLGKVFLQMRNQGISEIEWISQFSTINCWIRF